MQGAFLCINEIIEKGQKPREGFAFVKKQKKHRESIVCDGFTPDGCKLIVCKSTVSRPLGVGVWVVGQS